MPGGSRGLVQFQREAPKKGVAPWPEATTWTSGDRSVLIAFPDDPQSPSEGPLGYASQWLEGGRVCQVVVRNTSTQPATFDWIVTGPTHAIANWDVSVPLTSSQ